MLETKAIAINGENYVVQELRMKDMRKLMPRFGEEDSIEAQIEMIGLSVHQNGQPLGKDAVDELGYSAFQELQAAVLQVHGMVDVGKD